MDDKGIQVAIGSKRKKPVLVVKQQHYKHQERNVRRNVECLLQGAMVAAANTIGTFRSEYEYDYEYEFSVLSTRIRLRGRHFSKCACSERKTRTRSRSRTPI